MNIDELKYLWQENIEKTLDNQRLKEEDIRDLLGNRSTSALGKINRNIVIEMGVVALIGVLWGISLFLGNTPVNMIELGMLVLVVVGSAIFYRYKYLTLNKVAIQQGNLKESLASLVKAMGRFMKIYALGIIFVVPVFSIGGLFAGFIKGLTDSGRVLGDVSMRSWAIVALVSVVLVGVSILFSRWYLRRLYGIHYEELKKCLEELEERE